MSMKRALLTSVSSLATLLAPGAALAPAQADDPIDVTLQITDKAGAPGGAAARRSPGARPLLRPHRAAALRGLRADVRRPHRGGVGRPDLGAVGARQGDVLLAVATKDRAYGYHTDNTTFTADDLETVDRTRILPALRQRRLRRRGDPAADGFGDIAEDEGLPWGGSSSPSSSCWSSARSSSIAAGGASSAATTSSMSTAILSTLRPSSTSRNSTTCPNRALVAVDDALRPRVTSSVTSRQSSGVSRPMDSGSPSTVVARRCARHSRFGTSSTTPPACPTARAARRRHASSPSVRRSTTRSMPGPRRSMRCGTRTTACRRCSTASRTTSRTW